jgi:DNA-binding NarL/FixJ family response regulator
MPRIILLTRHESLKQHWKRMLPETYEPLCLEHSETLDYCDTGKGYDGIMIDEESLSDPHAVLARISGRENCPVLLFHHAPDPLHAEQFLRYHIRGYENAYLSKQTLSGMLHAISHGSNWFFPALSRHMLSRFAETVRNNAEPALFERLTQKERVIAKLILRSMSNAEIAEHEGIALSTVKGHVKHIFEKAEVNDRVGLVLKLRGA